MSANSTHSVSALIAFVLLPALYWLMGRYFFPLAPRSALGERVQIAGLFLLFLGYSPIKPQQITTHQILIQTMAWITVLGGVIGNYMFHIPYAFHLALTYGLVYGLSILLIMAGIRGWLRERRK